MVLRDVPERPLRGNLVLGPAAEDAWLAEAYAGRSDWPSVDTGYRTDSVTIYTSTIYDVQSQYDRYGSLYAGGTTVQMGTWSR